MLELAHPWLFGLLAVPWLVRRLGPALHRPRAAVQVPFMNRLADVSRLQPGSGSSVHRRRRSQWVVLGLAWLFLVTALARPQWLEQPLLKEEPMRDLLLALDLSGSMEVADFAGPDGAAMDRLSAAREVLDDFLTRREGDRVGLVLFGSAAFVQVPFTDDLVLVRELLGEASVRMLGPRTMLGDAIGLAISLFERSEVSERVLIVLTDGNDTGSLVPPERAAAIAADQGVTVHTIAMGDPAAAGEQALDEATLRAVATVTGGDYFRADDRGELEQVYARLDALNPRRVETTRYRPRTELYPWPAGAGLLLVLLFHAGNALRRRPGLHTAEGLK